LSRKSIRWQKLPDEVEDEVGHITKHTKRTGREASITICQKPDKSRVFVGSSAEGDEESTQALSCDTRYGKSHQIGTIHSHPKASDTVGIVPSEADLVANLSDSIEHKRAQVGCIVAPDNQFVNCQYVKEIPNRKKMNKYGKALKDSRKKTAPFFIDNVSKDFDIALYSSKTGSLEENPKPEDVVDSAFAASNKRLRERVEKMERGPFCDYIMDLMGQGHRNEVVQKCKEELKKRNFLGFDIY
jgi:hypothetical protein